MKKKFLQMVFVFAMTAAIVTGCAGKSDNTSENAAQATQESSKEATDTANETDAPEDVSTITGTIDEIKDFMFVVTDDQGSSYEFSYDQKPEGLDQAKAGDKVTVTYTGEISEVDPFTGEIQSVVVDK